jgi:DNA-binding beta-propeller fold protein YncE
MRLKILLLILAASVVFASFSSGARHGGTTFVTPPWTHCLGLHKVTQFHLDVYSGYREKFDDPEGLFCMKLACKDKPDTRRDDDELTVYGANSRRGDIIFNKSLVSIGIVGGVGGGPMQLRNPLALTGDKEGNLYVADTGNDRVARLRYANDELVWVDEIRGGDPRGLRRPSGVCLSGGKLYVADTDNDRIVVFDPDGAMVESFGAELGGASLYRPYAVAAITAGDEYLYYGDHFIVLTDSLGARLWKLSPDGKALALVRRGAIGGKGSFGHVAIDYYGNVYVTDREAGLIHKFDRHLAYIVAIGDRSAAGGPRFDEPRGISIYRRFGQVFVSERSGAQYFWIGTDVLGYAGDNLVFDTVRRRCSVDVAFRLTECSTISLALKEDGGETRFTIIPSYMLPPGRFSKRIEVDCAAAADLAKCKLRLILVASPTYSSREYLSVERESGILVSRVSDLPPARPR